MPNIVVTTPQGLAEILRVSTEQVRKWLKEKNLSGSSYKNNVLPIEVTQVKINPMLTPADVAAIFGVKEAVIKSWCREQKMECIVLNPKASHHIYRFTKEMVERHINKCWRNAALVYNGWFRRKNHDDLFWKYTRPSKSEGEYFADRYVKKYDDKLDYIIKQKESEHEEARNSKSERCLDDRI